MADMHELYSKFEMLSLILRNNELIIVFKIHLQLAERRNDYGKEKSGLE